MSRVKPSVPPALRSPKSRALLALVRIPWVRGRLLRYLFLKPFGSLRPEEREFGKTSGVSEWVDGASRVHVRRFGSGPAVLLVHGWGGAGEQMGAFVDPLVDRGYSVVAVDLPAHGRSARQTTNALDSGLALCAVARHVGDVAGVVAHSFGAAATMLALDNGLTPSALVFVAPLPNFDTAVLGFAEKAGLPVAPMQEVARQVREELGVAAGALNLAGRGPGERTPLLLIHDTDDRTIPLVESEQVAEAWPGARLLATQGLGHRRILRDREVAAQTAAFLAPHRLRRVSDLTELRPLVELGALEAL
jgi:pimeloyl-ACP methyl ester carboxylesterase